MRLKKVHCKYSRKGEGDGSRNRKCQDKKKCTQVKRKSEFSYKGLAVAMRKSSREEQILARTSSGIHCEKKLSSLLKVGKRSIDSSDSESFEALENKLKFKFIVEDDSSVRMAEGEEDDDA